MIPSRFIGRGMALLALPLFASGAPGAEKARLQLKWHHAFQFAGYYAAQAQGYYQAAGLELAGSKVLLGPDTTELCAYLQKEGIAAHISRRTPFSYDIEELLSGKADAMRHQEERFLYDPNPPPRDLTWFYATLATVASLLVLAALAAIRFARLSAALARSTQERLEQQARLLALEEERKSLRKQQRLIRDLHDGLGATSANLELLAERGRREGQADCKDKAFERISRLAQETSLEVRSLMDSLEVGGIGWGEVIENCRSRAALVFDPVGVHWEMAVTGTMPDGGLPSLAGLSLMRLLREAMNNILKHAHARTVRLHFVFGPERCCLTLQDDGCGFQPDPARPGRGLKNMRQRIEELGGAMRLETSLCENQRIKAATPEQARPCPRDPLNPDQLTGAGGGSARLIEVFSCGEGVGVRLMFEIPLPIQFHDTSAPSPGGRS